MQDSSAKLMSGMNEQKLHRMIRITAAIHFQAPSLMYEICPLLPVTVVKLFLLPVTLWLIQRMARPKMIMNMAMM